MDVSGIPLLFFPLIAGFSFLIGILIGTCGLGGVLIIPFLVYIADIEIHTVIPACMAGFVVAAGFANYAHARRGTIRWDKAIYLAVGAAPGAYLGSITVLALSSLVLESIITILVIGSGLRALTTSSTENSGAGVERVPHSVLTLIGFVVGYGSSVSGTGGPLLLMPTLLILNFPIMIAIGLCMAIQLSVLPFATFGHLMHGSIDWILAMPIAVGMSAGVLIGANIAHRISTNSIHRLVALSLLVSGTMMIVRIFV